MKVRICFSKTESGRYLSHLDLARTMERSLRRAKAPLAFSEGFNPHPKLAFASALAVGTTGLREYFDVDLIGRVNMGSFSRSLKGAFPPALDFIAVEEISENSRSLSAVVNLAIYRIDVPVRFEDEKKARNGLAEVLAAKELWRKPKEKPGKKTASAKEVRGLIRRVEVVEKTRTGAVVDVVPVTVEMELFLRADGQLRPQELWDMIGVAGGFTPGQPMSVCRICLLIHQDGRTFSPMEGVAIECAENC